MTALLKRTKVNPMDTKYLQTTSGYGKRPYLVPHEQELKRCVHWDDPCDPDGCDGYDISCWLFSSKPLDDEAIKYRFFKSINDRKNRRR